MAHIARPIKERFEEKFLINKLTGCWEWNAALSTHGYGKFSTGHSNWRLAHIISYEIYVGIIETGLNVCHHCDNPICVNPVHLFLGTQADNMKDMAKKKRGRSAPHPGVSHYKKGCRCEPCVKIYTAYINKNYISSKLFTYKNIENGKIYYSLPAIAEKYNLSISGTHLKINNGTLPIIKVYLK